MKTRKFFVVIDPGINKSEFNFRADGQGSDAKNIKWQNVQLVVTKKKKKLYLYRKAIFY